MTQGPWQNYGGPAGQSSDGIVVPARTSILAVSSLVFSLVCCIPGTGAIAAALGGGALVQIGRSEGRLTGKALAIVGLVLGMITSVIWIGGALGASAMWNGLRMAVEPAIASVQSSDVTKVKSLLTTQAAAAAGDAQIHKFSAEVNDKLGKFQGITASLIDVVSFYSSLSSIMPAEYLQEMQLGKSAFLPIPIDFEKGKAVIYFKLPAGNQSSAQSGSFAGMFTNIIIVLPDGTRLVMLDEAAAGANAPTKPGAPPADAPADGTEPGKKPGF
jgi:hypothetical protein